MRPLGVVLPTQDFGHGLRFLERVEDLAVEQRTAPAGVEAFAVAVLPRDGDRSISAVPRRRHGFDRCPKKRSPSLPRPHCRSECPPGRAHPGSWAVAIATGRTVRRSTAKVVSAATWRDALE